MKFSEMPYERPDMSTLKEQFAALTERLQNAPDYAAARAAFLEEQVLNKHFSKVLDREETDKERQKREARYAKMQAARENYNRQLEQQAQSKGGKKPQPQPKKKKTGESTTEAGKVGNRPYARGRAYREEHYDE